MSVTMLNANFVEAAAQLTPFSTSSPGSSFVEASSPAPQLSNRTDEPSAAVGEEVKNSNLTCPNCHRRFVYKLNYAKHVTMCCKETSNNNNNSTKSSKSSTIVQYCSQCELQLFDAASVERHRLAHGLVTQLSHSLQLTLTNSSPSAALEWFVGKIQFDFNDNGWGQSAVSQVDAMLTNCSLDDLLYLAKDSQFQSMVDVLLNDHHKQTTMGSRRHGNGIPAPSPRPARPQLIETGLVRPLVLHILSKDAKPTRCNKKPAVVPAPSPVHKSAAPVPSPPPDVRPLPTPSTAVQAGDQTPDTEEHSVTSTKYMCSECGACFSTASIVFMHMCRQHPLSSSSTTGGANGHSFRRTSLPFPPLVPDDLQAQQKHKDLPAEERPANPLPPCSSILQRKKRRRSVDSAQPEASKMSRLESDFLLEQLAELS